MSIINNVALFLLNNINVCVYNTGNIVRIGGSTFHIEDMDSTHVMVDLNKPIK